ncbi:MAG TPA: penicillin-binding transpeptidase domain-containing protein, partial [Candidatus Limnocylindria bacterium]|nr:penicillin-binding transpeptidase domain-containing protein [Candidatus Limnocylindria bacterium]
QAYRQSGSAFKPITYATGFERGVLSPATMIMDVQGQIVEGYTVPNADGGQRGPVRVRDALKYSWNIPVAKAQQMIGTENVVDMAERLGLEWDPRQEDEVAVPSLTLGTIGVHQIDLAAAYGALANGGVRAETYMVERITDRDGTVIYDHAQDAAQPQRVLSEQAAYLVTDILADNTDPAENSIWGTRFQLQTDEGRRPATLKTGTTNDFRDLQAFGFLAPDADPTVPEGAIVTGVWVGNSDFSPIADVFAADGPTFIWHDYMAEVTAAADLPLRDFPRPDGIVEVEVDAMSGLQPGDLTRTTVSEIFATSNQPQQQDTLHERLRIEDESGTIWQEGCGDQRETESGATGIFLDLVGWERDFQTWERANRRWIEQWRGREVQLVRSPAPRLDARLAPTQTCTPGEFPTSTPTPSPSPTPSPTPEATVAPTLEPTPTPSPTPEPTP